MRNRLFTVICSGAIAEIFNMKKEKKYTHTGKKRGMDRDVIIQGGLHGEANEI